MVSNIRMGVDVAGMCVGVQSYFGLRPTTITRILGTRLGAN